MTDERDNSGTDLQDDTVPRMRRAMAVLNGEALPTSEPITEHMDEPLDEPLDEPMAPLEGQPGETGGPKGPEPTRYGDWERKGRCIDF